MQQSWTAAASNQHKSNAVMSVQSADVGLKKVVVPRFLHSIWTIMWNDIIPLYKSLTTQVMDFCISPWHNASEEDVKKLLTTNANVKLEIDKLEAALKRERKAHEAALKRERNAHKAALKRERKAHAAALKRERKAHEAALTKERNDHGAEKVKLETKLNACQNEVNNLSTMNATLRQERDAHKEEAHDAALKKHREPHEAKNLKLETEMVRLDQGKKYWETECKKQQENNKNMASTIEALQGQIQTLEAEQVAERDRLREQLADTQRSNETLQQQIREQEFRHFINGPQPQGPVDVAVLHATRVSRDHVPY